MNKTIFICGFMASGKTTIGEALSKELNIPFIDTDDEIEKKSHFTIMEIFLKKQEQHFRKLETTILNKIKNNNPLIISTGGGMFTHKKNIKIAKKKGILVFLDVSLKNCILRSRSKKRPILTTKTFAEIENIYRNRTRKYIKFSDHIVKNNKTLNLAIYEIIKKLN